MKNNLVKSYKLFINDEDNDLLENKRKKYQSIANCKKVFDIIFEDYFINKFIPNALEEIGELNPQGLPFNYRFCFAYAFVEGDFDKYRNSYGFVFDKIVLSVYSASRLEYLFVDLFINNLKKYKIIISREMIKTNECAKFEFYATRQQLEYIYELYNSFEKKMTQ